MPVAQHRRKREVSIGGEGRGEREVREGVSATEVRCLSFNQKMTVSENLKQDLFLIPFIGPTRATVEDWQSNHQAEGALGANPAWLHGLEPPPGAAPAQSWSPFP